MSSKEVFYGVMYYSINLFIYPLARCIALLLLVWLVIKFLPTVLEKVGLQTAVDDTTLRWLNTALIGLAVGFAIIQPFIVLLGNYLPL